MKVNNQIINLKKKHKLLIWKTYNVVSHVIHCDTKRLCRISTIPKWDTLIIWHSIWPLHYVGLRHSSILHSLMVLFHCNIHWPLHYVGLRHSSIVHSLMVLLHWDMHRNDWNIYSMDIKIHHSSMLISHYSPSCCNNFLDIYIYSRLTKEMV